MPLATASKLQQTTEITLMLSNNYIDQCSSSVTSNSGNDCSKCFPSTSSTVSTTGLLVSRSSRCDATSEPGTSEFDSKKKMRKKPCRSGASRIFEPFRASGLLVVEVVGNQRHHLESKTSHRGICQWTKNLYNIKKNPTSEVNYNFQDLRNYTSLQHIHPWYSLLLPLREASFPSLASWSLSVCTTFRTFRSTLGGDKWRGLAGGQRRVVVTSTGLSTRWRANMEGMMLVQPRWKEEKKVREERPTTQVDEKWLTVCQSQRLRQWPDRWWNAWIMQTYCQTAASTMPSPRAKVWWAGAATIDVSPQVTKLTISSCPTHPKPPWNDFRKCHLHKFILQI